MQRSFQEANRHASQNRFFCDRATKKQKKFLASVRLHRHCEGGNYRDEREINELLNQLPQMLDSLESFQESR